MPKKIRTVLSGLGNVNLGLLKILRNKKQELAKNNGLEIVITGVADSSGIAIKEDGFDYEKLIYLKKNGQKVFSLGGHIPGIKTEHITNQIDANLLIESSPANLTTGYPGFQLAQHALTKGWSLVLANKAPLVFGFDTLKKLADQHGGGMAYSATVCGGLPVVNVLQRDMRMASLKSFSGILNATTNYILKELENGGTFGDAIKEAQRIGAAEADPSHDVNGHDTANKLFIIMKSFTSFSGTIKDINIEGIQHITAYKMVDASRRGKRIKLLAHAESKENSWILSVKPTEVPNQSFLGGCDGWEMGFELQTDLYEEICMKTYEADPLGTSAAVLRDILFLFESK